MASHKAGHQSVYDASPTFSALSNTETNQGLVFCYWWTGNKSLIPLGPPQLTLASQLARNFSPQRNTEI